jgi:hypothetical protein
MSFLKVTKIARRIILPVTKIESDVREDRMIIIDPILIPKSGFGVLKFGMTVDEVEGLLGLPDHMENPDEMGDISYEYKGIGINFLIFDHEEDFRLDTIELNETSNALLWNERIFELSYRQIESFCKANGYELEVDERLVDENDEFLELACFIHSQNIHFYFNESNHLKEVLISVYINEHDETIWPK